MRKRITAIILTLTLVWGSAGNIFQGGTSAALAETPAAATPTDLGCPHRDTRQIIYFYDSPTFTPIDADTHLAAGPARVETVCNECEAGVIDTKETDYIEEVRTHSFRDGVCSQCGYERIPEQPPVTQDTTRLAATRNTLSAEPDSNPVTDLTTGTGDGDGTNAGGDPAAQPGEDPANNDTKDAGEKKDEETDNQDEVTVFAAAPTLRAAPAMLGASGSTLSEIPYLQKLINDALSTTLKGRITVDLTKDTTYEGDVEIKTDAKDVADDFELELRAEDAGFDGVSGNGYTTVAGNITIWGIRVVMNSVVMAKDMWIKVKNAGATAGDNADRGGELEYNGTVNFNNEVNVDVGSNSSAELNFGDTNDKITVKTENGAKDVTVNAGDGVNTVKAEINGGDAKIETGKDPDTVTVETAGNHLGNVSVDTGASIDEVTVIHNGAAAEGKTVRINTGAGDDRVTVDVRENAGDITVDTGLGGDVVNVAKGNHHVFETTEYNRVNNPNEKFREEAATSTLTFVNSDDTAFDRFTIDVDVAGAVHTIAFEGGKGATVHLRGTLKSDPKKEGTEHTPIRWTKDGGIELDALMTSAISAGETDRTLTLKWQKTAESGKAVPSYNFTDALINKHTVYIIPRQEVKPGGTFGIADADLDFTDYVMKVPVNNLSGITVTGSDKPLMLSNFVIDTDQTLDSFKESLFDDDDTWESDNDDLAMAGYLKVPDITAPNLNVLLRSNTINMHSGRTITAQNVRLESISGTKTMGQAFGNLTSSFSDMNNYDSVYEAAEDFGISLGETLTDLFTLYNRSRIGINGTINATHNIEMFAKTKQFGNILGFWPAFLNPINVKLGEATIIVRGNAELTAGDNIIADAKVETITGMDYAETEDGSGQLKQVKSGTPVEITFIMNEAGVEARKGSTLKATLGDVALNSESKVTNGDYAFIGAFTSPFAAAIATVFNNVTTEVDGNVEAGRKVEARARGDVKTEAEVIKDQGYISSSAYFGAISFLDQNVEARYGSHAVVTAGQDVRADSKATADVATLAAASSTEQTSTTMGTAIGNLFVDTLIPLLKEKTGWTPKLEKVFETLNRVAAGSYEVKAINPSAEQQARGSASVTTYVDKIKVLDKDYVLAIVDVEPNEGYVVDKVMYRYLEPGEDHYTYKTAKRIQYAQKQDNEDIKGVDRYLLRPTQAYTEVIVTYKTGAEQDAEYEVIDRRNLEGAIPIDQLANRAARGINNDDDEEKFQELLEDDWRDDVQHILTINSEGGGNVVTWLTGKDKTNLKQIQEGQHIRLVPNPETGKKLEAMTVTYTTEDGIENTCVIAADNGIYSFTLPAEVQPHSKVTVNARFTAGEGEEQAPAYNQTTGSVALSWVMNDSLAVVDEGASVTAKKGNVELISLKTTDVETVADGTAIVDNAAPKTKEEEPKEKLFPQKVKYQVGDALYAIKLTTNVKDAVTGTIDRNKGANALMPIFTITPPDGADIEKTKVVLSYYSEIDTNMFGGTLRSQEFGFKDFTRNDDGTYSLKANLNATTILNGEVMSVSVMFADGTGTPLGSSGLDTSYLIRNPIATQVNELRKRDSDGKYVTAPGDDHSVGKLNYVDTQTVDGHTVYRFNLVKQTNATGTDAYKGYTIHETADDYKVTHKSNTDTLYAAWYDQNGSQQKMPLTNVDGYWVLDPASSNASIPEGALITVVAVFTEDNRTVKENKDDLPKDANGKPIEQGKTVISKTAAKYGDEVRVKLEPKDGYVPSYIQIRWSSGVPGESSQRQSLVIDDTNADGEFVFTMPWITESGTLDIYPHYTTKNVTLTAEGGLQLSEKGKGYSGEKITVQPSTGDVSTGKKITKVTATITFENGTTRTQEVNGDTFTIPVNEGNNSPVKSVSVRAETAQKQYQFDEAQGEYGIFVPKVPWVDPGETVQVEVKADEGYRVKFGTLKAKYRTASGSGEIRLKRVGPNLYEFTVPNADDIKSLYLDGEFEPGSDDLESSTGVSIAGAVILANNSVEIREDANVTAGKDLILTGLSNGNKATTEAYAGFSAAASGFAGGLAVQGASYDNDVRIHEGATLNIGSKQDDGGALSLLAKSSANFRVIGNASGNRSDEGGTGKGTGSGIAIAADFITDKAVAEDGVILSKLSKLSSISVNANHKTKDAVKATAGAKGGTSLVPVVAADVFSSVAHAKLGNISSGEALDVSGKVTVKAKSESAQVQYNHEVTADAKSAGATAAKGIALLVTWLRTDAKAVLNQAVNARDAVSVTSYAGDALKATASASAAGGYEGKRGQSGKGSADQQANGMLGNAANIAGMAGQGDAAANIGGDLQGRQLAETSETTATGAGALILNIHKNQSKAEIADDVNVTTAKKLTVQSQNRTEAKLEANASATKSDTGLGVGVAINIVRMDNIARIGTGRIEANEVLVEAKLAEMPPEIRTMKMVLGTGAMQSELEAALEEMLRDLLGDKIYEAIGTGMTKFASTFWAGLVRDLNLQQIMDIRDNKGTANFYSLFDTMKDALLNYPLTLIEPYKTAAIQAFDGIDGFDADSFGKFLLSEVTTQLWSKGYQSFLKNFISGSGNEIVGAVVDILNNKISGKGGGGDVFATRFKNGINKALRGWVEDFLNDFQVKLATQFPVLNTNNRDAVTKFIKDVKNLTVKEMGQNFANQLLETFRRDVYDYEPVMTQIQSKGFLGFIKDEAIKLLKESAAAMTNEMLDSIAGKLDIRFEREEVNDRHVLKTVAIAGAGASGKSQAGSIAVTVADLTTKAEIKDSKNTVTVTGDGALAVNAEEQRLVWTHATAAVDARTGEANNNDGAGESENRDNGGANAGGQVITSEDGVVAVKAGVGGSVRYAANGTDLYIEQLKEGYKKDQVTVRRTYVLEDGTQIVDNIQPEKYYDDFIMNPVDGIDIDQLKDGTQVEIDVEFIEDIRNVPAVTISNEDSTYADHDGKITLCVEGAEKTGKTTKAKPGDLVEIHMKRVPGLTADSIRVYGADNVTPLRLYDSSAAENVTIREAYSNGDEIVYVFKMPEEDIDRILFSYKGRYDKNAKAESTNSNGESVGRGGAFAWTWGDSTVAAQIGKRGTDTIPDGKEEPDPGVTAGSISVTAYSKHEEQNFSTAGTDPFEGTSSIKDAGTDVALSLNMLDNDITARIAEGNRIRTTGTAAGGDEETEEVKEKDLKAEAGGLLVHSTEYSKNETRASAFATGSTSAVGASVAANISRSDVDAEMSAEASLTGSAIVRAFSESQDRTWSFASSMGADVQRALNKMADYTEGIEKTASGVADGSFNNELAKKNDKKKNTNAGNQIADRLNQDRAEGGQEAAGNLGVGANIARVANVEVDNAEEADGAEGRGRAQQLAQENGVGDANVQGSGQKTRKLQAAAAIGFTLAKHNATVTVKGSINAAQDIDISTMNAGNFNTRATSASITTEDMGKGKSISAAIGVSISKNKSTIDIGSEDKEKQIDLISANGDVTVDAELTQNQTDVFRGYLAVQSLSGAVSGENASGSIAGAVSSVFSWAETAARVNSKGSEIEGDAVTIRANDKSKLAVRAGGINYSKGASVGLGVSVATIWSGNTVEATLNNNATVTANSFDLTAQKEKVTFDDYKFPLKLTALISDTSELTDEQRQNAQTGIIDIHKDPGKSTYTVDININMYTLMQIPDMFNQLASQNYYTEAIAGSVISGGTNNDFNGAGSFAIIRAKNKIDAVLGDGVTVKRKTAGQTDGIVNVSAKGDTTARMIGGAVSAGAAKTTAGVTVTFLYDEDKVNTGIGDNLTIEDAGDVNISSKGGADVQAFNAAAAIATSYNAKLTAGGALNILILKNIAKTDVGKNSNISAKGSLGITSDSDMDLMLISVSAAGSTNANAVGGTVAFVFDTASAKAHMGSGQTLAAGKDITLRGRASEDLLSILPSAAGSGKGNAFAGVLNVLDAESKGILELDAGSGGIESTGGSISFIGKTDTRAINVTLAGAGSGAGSAVGLSVNVNVFARESKVDIGGAPDYMIKAAKDILSVASGDDTTVMASAAVTGGSGTGIMVSGNAAVVVGRNQVTNKIGDADITAAGEAAFSSYLRDRTYVVEGSVAVSVGGGGVGGAYMFLLKENTVHTELGKAKINAMGRSGKLAAKVPGIKAFEGLYVGARVQDTIVAVAAGVTYGTEFGITANIMNVINHNEVWVRAENAALKAKSLRDTDGDGEPEETGEGGSVLVEARNDSSSVVIAGGINASMAVAGGAGFVTLYARKNVSAKVGSIKADRNVDVNAYNKDLIVQMNISAGGAGTVAVEVAISYQDLANTAEAIVAGDVRAEYGSFSLTSNNDTDIVNAAIAGGGSGAVAVSPVAVLQFFRGSSEAYLKEGTVYAALNVNVLATSDKLIDQFTIGVAGSGLAAVAGGVTIQSVKDSTKAAIGQSVVIERATSLSVHAWSDYTLLGISGLAAGAVGGGIAVNVMLTIMKANTLAEMEGTATLTGGTLEVRATSNRWILDIGGTLSGGTVGVGVTLAGLVSGTKMDQDEADMLAYGDTSDKSKTTFSTSGVAKMMKDTRKSLGLKEDYMNTEALEGKTDKDGKTTGGLGKDIEGNGNHNTEMTAGTDGTFDAKGAAVDDSVYEQRGKADASMTDGKNEDDETPLADGMEDKELGEKDNTEETEDIKHAKELGGSVYDAMPDDAVVARIGSNAKILHARGVVVEAIQGTDADVVAGTVTAGILGGGASGAAFALLHSNVSASSQGELQDVEGGEVRVQAVSAAGRVGETKAGLTYSKAEALAGGFSSDYNKKNRDEELNAQIQQNTAGEEEQQTGTKSADGKKAEDMTEEEKKAEEEKKTEAQQEKEDNKMRTVSVEGSMLRVVGISAAFEGMPDIEGDSYGGAVILGVLRSDNVTQAVLGNTVNNTGLVNVNAVADYKNLFAFTLGAHVNIAGSKGANSVSVAVATSEGDVSAKIDETAYITGTGTNVNVTTDSDTTVTTLAATIGVALSGGDSGDADVGTDVKRQPAKLGGLSIALNKVKQRTAIEKGAVIEAQDGNVKLKADSDTTAGAYLISGKGSAKTAIGLNIAIVSVRPDIKTTVGVEGESTKQTNLKKLNNVTVSNNVDSESNVGVLSLSVGLGGSFQGNGLLVFNDTDATAKVANTNLDVQNLTIKSDLGAEGDSKILSVVAGKAAVGISVAYVDVNSKSNAELDTSKVTGKVKDTLTVESGTAGKKTKALALGVAAAVGYYGAGGINVTLSKNSAENNAAIYGSGNVNAATVNVNAKSDATTRTRMYGLNLGLGATVAGTAESVKNAATSRATVTLENGTINGDLNISSNTTGSTKAYMLTGSGALIGVTTNVVLAHGKTRSLVDVNMARASTNKVAINATNEGNQDDLKVDINNQNFNAITVGVMVGLGYSQDIYQTRIKLSGNQKLKELKAKTDYSNETKVEVTPSAAGVSVSISEVYVNVAKAKNTVYAGTEVDFSNVYVKDNATDAEKEKAAAQAALKANHTVKVDGDLDIQTTGKAVTKSNIRTAALKISIGYVNVSVAHATQSARQAALLNLSGTKLTVDKALNVQSLSKGAEATARVGGMGLADGEAGLEITFASVGVNSAKAWENMDSTAGIIGNGKAKDTISAKTLDVRAENVSGATNKATARTTRGAEVSVNSGGGLLGQAISSDSYNSVLQGVAATISGKVYLTAITDSHAKATGEEPGGLTGVKVRYSEMKAYMGEKKNKQTAKVLIGNNTDLTTLGTDSDLYIQAENKGNAEAAMDGGVSITLVVAAQVSKMPTTSWYDTAVLVGKNSVITSGGKAAVTSTTKSKAKSDMDAATFVGGINAQHMQGKNVIHDQNWIDIGEKSKVIAQKNITIKGVSNTQARATSDFDGGAILVSGSRLLSENQINRDVIVNIAKGAQVNSKGGNVNIESVTGEEDWILTAATVGTGSLFDFGRTVVTVGLEANNEIHIASGVQIDASKDVNIIARASGKQAPGLDLPGKFGKIDGAGIYSYASSYGEGFLTFVYGITEMTMKLSTVIALNRDSTGESNKTAVKSNGGNVYIMASNNDLNVKAEGKSHTYGVGGNSTAKGGIDTEIMNSILLDNVELGGATVRLLAGYEIYADADKQTAKPRFTTYSNGFLGEIGRVKSQSNINGSYHNQIRTNYPNYVDDNVLHFIHTAYDPLKIAVVSQTMNITGPLGVEVEEEKEFDWKDEKLATFRCDLCKEGSSKDVGYRDLDDQLAASFEKALAPVQEINAKANEVRITRARYGDEENAETAKLYVLEIASPLEEDVLLSREQLNRYNLWTNSRTSHNVYLLPNATRLFTLGNMRMQYVSEVLRGDVLGNGEAYDIEIVTALTQNAARNPILPIGANGSLDFRTGELTLPAQTDFEVYLREISSAWLLEKLQSGFLQRVTAEQGAINDSILNGSTPPNGSVTDGLSAGEALDGDWIIYWLGHTPETAETDNEVLVYLLVNPETDEVKAFRTSVEQLEKGEEPIAVSLYLFRDRTADRKGEEKYNIFFFDTPEGEKSLVKIVTSIPGVSDMVLPMPMKVVLRGIRIEGADYPVYSLTDHFFAMCDGTDGEVSMFDGFYQATVQDDTFESDYLLITGLSGGNPQVTVKGGQTVWPEDNGDGTATAIDGKEYKQDGDSWYSTDNLPSKSNEELKNDAA